MSLNALRLSNSYRIREELYHMREVILEVEADDAGIRIDSYLSAAIPELSRS